VRNGNGRVIRPQRGHVHCCCQPAIAYRGHVQTQTATGREFIALVTVLMATSAIAIDLMLPAFPDIRAEYGMSSDSSQVGWIVTAFFLGLAIGPWLYGPMSDRYGRRPLLFAGLVLYVVAAGAALVAPSFGWLIAARFVWGLGAAAPRWLSVAMIRDRYEGDSMARLMSMIMAVFLLVPIMAPGLGAALNLVLPWRVVLVLPACLAVGLMVWSRRLPETLPPERRRPFTWASVSDAARQVVTHRQTMSFTLAVMFLFGVMTTYLAGFELIIEDVYGYGSWFPVLFGAIAALLAASSLNNARLVQRIGVTVLVRRLAVIAVGCAVLLMALSLLSGGQPPFWVFTLGIAALMPLVQGLIPNCNTAAMTPLPHVAGTASAIIGTVTVAGGALIGSLASGAFDGTVRPFSAWILVFVGAAAALILFGATTRRGRAGEGTPTES
jgi:MFS transporter, DHA1 family, multidrug resistance protein